MNRAALRALVLVLPLAGLGFAWAQTHVMAQQGVDWEVPIEGYDPRDLLRGHYIMYRYDWPGLEQPGERSFPGESTSRLCIAGTAPRIERTWRPGPDEDCENLLVAREYTQEGISGLDSGIFYVPQAKARAMQDKLWDRKLQAFVTIRVRNDGFITPVNIAFRPRSR